MDLSGEAQGPQAQRITWRAMRAPPHVADTAELRQRLDFKAGPPYRRPCKSLYLGATASRLNLGADNSKPSITEGIVKDTLPTPLRHLGSCVF